MRSERVVAAETVVILARGRYTAPSGRGVRIRARLEAGVRGSRLYRPDELDALVPVSGGGDETVVEVTGETTLAAARRVSGEGEVACLNFASANNPGGGFRSGARAQEESLARSSGLYPALLAARGFYDFHRARHDPLYSDHVIYSPGVVVFRDDSGELLEEPYDVAFLTSAAPNRGAVRDKAVRARIPGVLERRAAKVLAVAHHHGHLRVVLGAWGCGVFRNVPEEVAGAFAALLLPGGPFAGRFEHVVFAVHDPAPRAPRRTAFEKAFAI